MQESCGKTGEKNEKKTESKSEEATWLREETREKQRTKEEWSYVTAAIYTSRNHYAR